MSSTLPRVSDAREDSDITVRTQLSQFAKNSFSTHGMYVILKSSRTPGASCYSSCFKRWTPPSGQGDPMMAPACQYLQGQLPFFLHIKYVRWVPLPPVRKCVCFSCPWWHCKHHCCELWRLSVMSVSLILAAPSICCCFSSLPPLSPNFLPSPFHLYKPHHTLLNS